MAWFYPAHILGFSWVDLPCALPRYSLSCHSPDLLIWPSALQRRGATRTRCFGRGDARGRRVDLFVGMSVRMGDYTYDASGAPGPRPRQHGCPASVNVARVACSACAVVVPKAAVHRARGSFFVERTYITESQSQPKSQGIIDNLSLHRMTF